MLARLEGYSRRDAEVVALWNHDFITTPRMPVTFSIKNVPDDVAAALRARAARHRRSLQRELLIILEGATGGRTAPSSEALAPGGMSVEEMFERTARLLPKGTPSSAGLLREMRDLRSGLVGPSVAPRRRRDR